MTSARTALLIADLGGYTAYMSSHRMTLAHAEVNTARILDRMIRAAHGFDLIEVEGDAAFLSRPSRERDPDTTVAEILQAAEAMHRAFEQERDYVAVNLCPCGGCREMGGLTLKFVAHVGDVATQNIQGRTKLVGIDVILVHRLLKNSVPLPEYVLLTGDLYDTAPASVPGTVQEITPDLEGIGAVTAYYVDVADIETGGVPAVEAAWHTRLGSTFSAIGRGLPYMLGRKQYRSRR